MAKYICDICEIEFETEDNCFKHRQLVHEICFCQCNKCGDFLPKENTIRYESYDFCHNCILMLPEKDNCCTSATNNQCKLNPSFLADAQLESETEKLTGIDDIKNENDTEVSDTCKEDNNKKVKIKDGDVNTIQTKILDDENKKVCYVKTHCNNKKKETDLDFIKLKKATKLLTVSNCFYCEQCEQEFVDAFKYYTHDCQQQLPEKCKCLKKSINFDKRFSNFKQR